MKLFYSTCILLLTSVSLAQQSSASRPSQAVQSGQAGSGNASGSSLTRPSGQSAAAMKTTTKKNDAGSSYSTYLPVLVSAQVATYIVYTLI